MKRSSARAAVPSRKAGNPGLFIAPACKIFEDLGVGGSFYREGSWQPIHGRAELLNYEIEHGRIGERYRYNDRCLKRAVRKRVSVLAQHRGFSDLFVPVCASDGVQGVLVVGPFGSERPSGAELHERWRSLTGGQGHLADPEFAHYVSTTLSLTVFEGRAVHDLQRLIECLARLIAAEGDAPSIQSELAALRERLLSATFVARVWEAARLMTDERTRRVWSASSRKDQRPDLGLLGVPQHAAVGLVVSGTSDNDPLEDFVRRNAFQRAFALEAARWGGVLAGRVGDHGVALLAASRGSQERSRRWLSDLAERAASLARRRFTLRVRFGIGVLPTSVTLPRQYQAALAAAEAALSDEVSIVHATPATPHSSTVGKLRQELVRLIEVEPSGLAARFDRFLEAVAVRTAFRPEPARVHLEIAFEQMTQSLLPGGALEARDLDVLAGSLERHALESQTLSELFGVYRSAVRDLVEAVQRPVAARRERSLRRAEEYVRQHYAEPVALAQVARVGGFAPNYFSVLFHKKHGVTFEKHLQRLRVERAKELLIDTSLSLQRIAQLSGFARASYLSRLIKAQTSQTPIGYRWSARHLPRERTGRRSSKRN